MKRSFYLVILLVLALGSNIVAKADDVLVTNDAAFSNDVSEANSMTWPMLPGENVHDLARLFYPKNRAMQRQFVAKTLRLNADTQPSLKATTRFDEPTLLVVPTLKSLSKNAIKSNKKSLKMSFGLKQAVEGIPQELMQEYEQLVNKNTFLKEQLAKLNEKILLLQGKLHALKLIFDKTLTLPSAKPSTEPNVGIANTEQPAANQTKQVPTATSAAVSALPAKKVLKNLNQTPAKPTRTMTAQVASKLSFFESMNVDLIKIILAATTLLLLSIFLLKKYRERMYANLSFSTTKAQHTVTDFSGYVEDKNSVKEEVKSLEAVQQVKAAKEVETRLSATLEEAKLLISVNRVTDAIAHLKATIASQPKASISHWLYLLEVFRKLNMKEDFEQYAESLHQTFNVMTPIWYEKLAAIYVPQSLEEFPHIMQQLYGVWPGELASLYLRSLIADNRGGDRVGFGKEVLDEILMLITLLDTHKELPN